MLITENYRELNKTLHGTHPDYGTSSRKWVPRIQAIMYECGIKEALDYGCGKGDLARKLGSCIREYDPAIPGKELLPTPADLVVCTDVLEHVEPECIDAVLDHLQQLTQFLGFFTIATRPAKKTLADGRNTHILLRKPDWWLKEIANRFYVLSWSAVNPAEIVTTVKSRRINDDA